MQKSLSLLLDLYELTMAESYLRYKRNASATFDLFARGLPKNRSYLVFCGLQDTLNYIKDLKFTKADLGHLKKLGYFSPEFLDYLSGFKFKGDIWAMPEGTPFFANEPVIRVTAPIIQAQILESCLLNTVNLQAMIASKASRVVNAARGRGVYDFSLRRTHGSDAAIKAARSSYVAGCRGTSNVLAGLLYKIPVVGTMAHSFVMTFRHEIDSFLAYSDTFPDKATLLVDTYDTKKGIENAVTVGLYLKEKGYRLQGIRLDSGDIAQLSRLARNRLDKAGLNYVKIFASGNLDEFKISGLLNKGARLDSFGVGTNMGTSIDAASLDVIYKISEVTDDEGNFLPTMKLSRGKTTYPGRKQVYRVCNKKGIFIKDILGLDTEKIKGAPLLRKVVDKGRIIYRPPSLDKIRGFAKYNLSRFPGQLKEVYPRTRKGAGVYVKYKYPVLISPKLNKLRQGLVRQLGKRQ